MAVIHAANNAKRPTECAGARGLVRAGQREADVDHRAVIRTHARAHAVDLTPGVRVPRDQQYACVPIARADTDKECEPIGRHQESRKKARAQPLVQAVHEPRGQARLPQVLE